MRSEQLECFIAICQTGSINKAARVLNTSPQNVSKMLKQFEDEIGAVLVERSPKGILLTKDGLEVLEWAKQTMEGWDGIKKKHQFSKKVLSNAAGEINLLCSSMYNLYFLDDCLAAFNEAFPRITINFINTIGGERILQALTARPEETIAVVPILYNKGYWELTDSFSQYQMEIIHYDRLVVLVDLKSALNKYDRIPMREVLAQNLILSTSSSNEDSFIMSFLKKHGDHKKFSYTVRNPFNVFDNIQNGMGIGLVQLDLFLHNNLVNKEQFRVIEIAEESTVATVLLSQKKGRLALAIKYFMQFAHDFYHAQ